MDAPFWQDLPALREKTKSFHMVRLKVNTPKFLNKSTNLVEDHKRDILSTSLEPAKLQFFTLVGYPF
jgi:hypothetical protein